MNFAHNRLCAGKGWAEFVDGTLLPWGLEDVELGDRVLEIGPGSGQRPGCWSTGRRRWPCWRSTSAIAAS
jgi:hypothetical protein